MGVSVCYQCQIYCFVLYWWSSRGLGFVSISTSGNKSPGSAMSAPIIISVKDATLEWIHSSSLRPTVRAMPCRPSLFRAEITSFCGLHRFWTRQRWSFVVCPDFFLCEDCFQGLDGLQLPPLDSLLMSVTVTEPYCDGCKSVPILTQRWHCKVLPWFWPLWRKLRR